jgi:hypothetical protein
MEQFYTYLAGQAFISVLPKKTPGSNLPINTTRTIQSSIPVHIKRKPVNKQVIIPVKPPDQPTAILAE